MNVELDRKARLAAWTHVLREAEAVDGDRQAFREIYREAVTAGAPREVLDLLDHIEESDWGKL